MRLDPNEALVRDRMFEACVGFKQRIKADAESVDWPNLLLVAARDPNCLTVEQGDKLSAFGLGKPEWRDAVAEWTAGHGGGGVAVSQPAGELSASTRLRLALRGVDAVAVRTAAGEALQANPKDTFACAILVRDAIDRGELAEAESVSHCADTSEMVRLRAEALDAGGRYEDAVAAYDKAGFSLHAAAILYQSLNQPEAALFRMTEPIPPVAIHLGWMAVMRGETPDVSGLDASPEATMLRAIAGDAKALAELADLPGIEPKLLGAWLAGDHELGGKVIALVPFSRRALITVWRTFPVQEMDWVPLAMADGDHLDLAGDPGRREAPLAGIVPEPDRRHPEISPRSGGRDEVGAAWRAALKLDPISRDQALSELQAAHPELRVLARVRARATWGLPTLPGDPGLDAPPALE